MTGKYDDIIGMPRPVSETHPHMSLYDRAAQFSPFAALTGFDAAIDETARITESRIELDDAKKEILNEQLCVISGHIDEQPKVTVTYFMPDVAKDGGSYVDVTGNVTKINVYEKYLVINGIINIPIDDIIEINCDLFLSIV